MLRKLSHLQPIVDPERETRRLEALDALDVLDTPPEEAFERIAQMIKTVLGVPTVLVSFLDGHRQWHKAVLGMREGAFERKNTFCQYTILGSDAMVVPDAHRDPRFADSPYVTGEPGIRFYAGAPMTTKEGHNVGVLCAIDSKPRQFTPQEVAILEGFASLAMSELELRQLASTDALTGVLSRRSFRQAGEAAMALALREERELSCIAVDLDRFKSINDRFGHPGGDAVLKKTADTLRGDLRDGDHLGRLGGEEFAILLPGADRDRAAAAAERLRAAIERMTFEGELEGFTVTASFGVASLGRAAQDYDTLLALADAALYEAKNTGRNRCVVSRAVGSPLSRGRRHVLKAGLLDIGDATLACTVKSLGDDGAGIDLVDSSGLPDRFLLSIPSDELDVACRVVARARHHVEVVFCR